MASKGAQKRLTKEYKSMVENPPPYIIAHPSEANILEWHYLITGPNDTPYAGGQYHGTVIFPKDYPFRPPEIRMITPNGRFQTNTRLCLSMSDYHPDLWQPAWSVATILNGLLSFMTGDEPTTGSITTSDETKRRFAKSSLEWNAKSNAKFAREFADMIPENLQKVSEIRKKEEEEKQKKLLERERANALASVSLNDNVDLDKMDPEDRIRYLAAKELNKGAINGSGHSHLVYYFVAIAVVLGFFKFVN